MCIPMLKEYVHLIVFELCLYIYCTGIPFIDTVNRIYQRDMICKTCKSYENVLYFVANLNVTMGVYFIVRKHWSNTITLTNLVINEVRMYGNIVCQSQ